MAEVNRVAGEREQRKSEWATKLLASVGSETAKPPTWLTPKITKAKAEQASLKVLEEHLESGRPDSWRPALRILEHAWGRPKETVEVQEDLADKPVDALTLEELLVLGDRIIAKHGLSPHGDN